MNPGCNGCEYAYYGTCTYPYRDCPVMCESDMIEECNPDKESK